ncbi:MAG TPA: AMP-binding protein, partial [Anaerolineales bacterium]|nr:AMP-binding protein [Anaerolineales bacterium]
MRLSDLRVRTPADFTPLSEEIFQTTLVPQFERRVEDQPDHAAIRRGSVSLTYRELNNAVNHIAHRILLEGGSDSSPVAILVGDEVLCIAAALAVVKSGRPYVLLYPGRAQDTGVFLKDSQAGLLLASADQAEVISALPLDVRPARTLSVVGLEISKDSPNPDIRLDANGAFAIYYTSGSTGKPKGVLEGHLGKAYRAFANINVLKISPSDRVALVLSVWHTGALSNLLSTLVSGATLYPLDLRGGEAQDAANWLVRERITAIWCMPSILRSIFQNAPAGLVLQDLRFMRLGGETISNEDIELFKAHTAPDCLLNLIFATSEASAVSEYPVYHHTPPFEGPVPAGFPIPGVEVTIED